jgi:hypothetical protein
MNPDDKAQEPGPEKPKSFEPSPEEINQEFALRDSKAPWPKTYLELSDYIHSLAEQKHTYGTCVYAVSLAATAAFNFMSGKLGITGFQASAADLDVIRRTRSIEGSFILFKAEDLLYPQYDLEQKMRMWAVDQSDWLAERAKLKLAEFEGKEHQPHPDVLAHWKKLAANAGTDAHAD